MEKTEYNYQKLLGAIKEKGYTQEAFARAISISSASLNLKLNNKREFRQNEMKKSFIVLNLPTGSMEEYFFDCKL